MPQPSKAQQIKHALELPYNRDAKFPLLMYSYTRILFPFSAQYPTRFTKFLWCNLPNNATYRNINFVRQILHKRNAVLKNSIRVMHAFRKLTWLWLKRQLFWILLHVWKFIYPYSLFETLTFLSFLCFIPFFTSARNSFSPCVECAESTLTAKVPPCGITAL